MKTTEIGRNMQKYAATLTLNKPGSMSEQGRRDIAAWLRQQATDLIKHGKDYNDTGDFRARYFYTGGST